MLRINSKGLYHKATAYTPYLSAFIKMAQLLIVQRAVLVVDKDKVDHAVNILNVI
jgi:hypothetical protein